MNISAINSINFNRNLNKSDFPKKINNQTELFDLIPIPQQYKDFLEGCKNDPPHVKKGIIEKVERDLSKLEEMQCSAKTPQEYELFEMEKFFLKYVLHHMKKTLK